VLSYQPVCNGSKITIRHLQKQTFLNDRLWKVGTGCLGRPAAPQLITASVCYGAQSRLRLLDGAKRGNGVNGVIELN
jgi:hypothetical protein